MNFYRHKNLDVQQIDNMNALLNMNIKEQTFLYSPRMLDAATVENYQLVQVYSSLPEWIRKFNFNNWLERTRIGVIYKFHD